MRSSLLLAAGLIGLLAAGAAGAADRGTTQVQPSVRGAVMAPLEDINIKQADIPDALNRAVANPYDVKGMGRCEAVAGEIGRLDAALGPDLDEAPPASALTRTQKVGEKAKGLALDAATGEAHSLIPFRGWVRKLSGAERHDKLVQAAIRAGVIRRGYLKGYGMQMNCAPPAAPSWFVPRKPAPIKAKVATTPLEDVIAQIKSWWPW